MVMQNEMLRRRMWVVEYRDKHISTSREIEAWKVEGWSNDYAFFDSDGRVFLLIPRDIVVSVGCIRTLDE